MLGRFAPRDARDRMIVGLDVPSVEEARRLVKLLGAEASFYKIGMQLVFAGGLALIDEFAAAGKRIFLDMKLLDIDNTITGGIASIARLGVTFTTIHAYPKAMRAAVAGRPAGGPGLLAVTVLTSMDDADLRAAGYAEEAAALVAKRAAEAQKSGMDGIVCAPSEVSAVRRIVGPKMAIVAPGIRPAGAAAGDQKRVMTPAEAIAAGADYIVVARPVIAAADPAAAARSIIAEIEKSLPERESMPKGYWIVRADVSDPEAYKKYVAANAEPLARHGARFLVRGGTQELREGAARARNVVVEFPSVEAARKCYDDAGYQSAIGHRRGAAVFDLIIIEGYDGPQPGA
jgi:orotidine-5'-phosphate decarboxylase